MYPDPATVLRRRHAVLVGLRVAAIALAAIGVITVGRHLVPLTKEYIGFGEWSYWAAVFAGVVLFGVPSLMLAIFSAALARWIVPASLHGCPTCGYAVGSITSGTCPECGSRLPTQPPTPSPSTSNDRPPPNP